MLFRLTYANSAGRSSGRLIGFIDGDDIDVVTADACAWTVGDLDRDRIYLDGTHVEEPSDWYLVRVEEADYWMPEDKIASVVNGMKQDGFATDLAKHLSNDK